MSYLSGPRLIFSGSFQADPSTVNNDPHHFDSARFRSNYQLPGEGATNGWWNPEGSGAWRLVGCTVTAVVYADGTVAETAAQDPIIGLSLRGADRQVEGKLVDLDPEQQMVSQIWGLQIRIGSPQGEVGLHGHFRVAPFADIYVRYPQGQPDSFFSAFYQSTLERVSLRGLERSRYLQEARAGGEGPLSIRFTVDGYNDDRGSDRFTLGRVVGAIGAQGPQEPRHFVAGRRLKPNAAGRGLSVNTAYALLDAHGQLQLDLSNSLPTTGPGQGPVDLGDLAVGLLGEDGAPQLLGVIPYRSPEWYPRRAGITTLPLSPAQQAAVAAAPLQLFVLSGGAWVAVASEHSNGEWVRADNFVARANPGDSVRFRLYATRFGQPLAGATVALGYDPSILQGQIQQGPISGPRLVGEPRSAFTFAPSLVTDEQGIARFVAATADPGNPRRYIDGQLYAVSYRLGLQPPPVGMVSNPSEILSVLLWSGYTAPERPTWVRDVAPIFTQYANLYPVMARVLNLANYGEVLARRGGLQRVFSVGMEDPLYMPVTRDLSAAKRRMLLQWLERPLYLEIRDVDDLKIALQMAIELEHSTIPVYLSGLYSIKPGANTEITRLLRSVVVEEMSHMAIAANVLISIGGAPQINRPGFVPNYPTGLPGGLCPGLTVRLRRFSIEQVREVYMGIEQPSRLAEQNEGSVEPGAPIEISRFTIGWFYRQIQEALIALSKAGAITFGHTDRQVLTWRVPGRLVPIDSLEAALSSLGLIQREGEGSSPFNPGDGEQELAHYYKFAEIAAGRRIVVDAQGGFSYTGAPIAFDPEGVYPMMDDPNTSQMTEGSRAQIQAGLFNETYAALLNALHHAFNGAPERIGGAIGLMTAMEIAAKQLVTLPTGKGTQTAGPTFQLPFPE